MAVEEGARRVHRGAGLCQHPVFVEVRTPGEEEGLSGQGAYCLGMIGNGGFKIPSAPLDW